MPRRSRFRSREVVEQPETVEQPTVETPVEIPEVVEVVVRPTVDSLRERYERLAEACRKAKRDTPEFHSLMEQKRTAFIAWHRTQ